MGFSILTTTVVCEDCGELYNAITAGDPRHPTEARLEPGEPACPEDPDHHVQRWRYPGPCPKCGRWMVSTENWLLWD